MSSETPKVPEMEKDTPIEKEVPVEKEVQTVVLTPEELEAKKKAILKQIEYYLGDYNLSRDKFFKEEIAKDEGWIPISVMLNCKRLANISSDTEVIFDALKDSELVEVDVEAKKLRRSPSKPLVEVDAAEEVARTLYVKGFPKDGSINQEILSTFLEPLTSSLVSIKIRNFVDKVTSKTGFKGSIFIVFKTVEDAEKFMKIDEVRYKNIPLIRLSREDYENEKEVEKNERILQKQARNAEREQKQKELEFTISEGSFLHISDVPEDANREQIKAAINDLTSNLAFFGYRKGEGASYLRVVGGTSKEVFESLNGKLKFEDTPLTVRLVEGEEETVQRDACIAAKKNSVSNNFSHHNRKRRGSQRGNYHSKRRRT